MSDEVRLNEMSGQACLSPVFRYLKVERSSSRIGSEVGDNPPQVGSVVHCGHCAAARGRLPEVELGVESPPLDNMLSVRSY